MSSRAPAWSLHQPPPGDTQVLLVQEPFSWDDSVFQFMNHNVNGRNITF
ncbi:MAG: hypothetical protein IPM84_25885 [Anaerolineae bacterium]|nr:hypothetical protein [Anaerolineae bacterium]